jgi:hypothetical protein
MFRKEGGASETVEKEKKTEEGNIRRHGTITQILAMCLPTARGTVHDRPGSCLGGPREHGPERCEEDVEQGARIRAPHDLRLDEAGVDDVHGDGAGFGRAGDLAG